MSCRMLFFTLFFLTGITIIDSTVQSGGLKIIISGPEVGENLFASIEHEGNTSRTLNIEGIAFEVQSADSYVGFAISGDMKMGDDIAFICTTAGPPRVMKIPPENGGGKGRPVAAALMPGQEVKGNASVYSATDKILECKFTIPTEITLSDNSLSFKIVEKELVFLIASGAVTGNGTELQYHTPHGRHLQKINFNPPSENEQSTPDPGLKSSGIMNSLHKYAVILPSAVAVATAAISLQQK